MLDQGGRLASLTLVEERLVAMSLDDDAMLPVFRPGTTILVARAAASEPAALVGRHVVAELACGRQFLRRLMPASEPDNYLLTAYQAPVLGPLRPVAVRLVMGQLEAEACQSGDKENSSLG
jgi:hypothetical protein